MLGCFNTVQMSNNCELFYCNTVTMQVQFSKWQVVNKDRSKNLNWDVETELISILTVKAYLVWYQDQNSYSNWSYLVNILNSLNLNVIVHTRHLFQLFAYALQNIYRIHFGNLECNYFPQKNGTRICEFKKKILTAKFGHCIPNCIIEHCQVKIRTAWLDLANDHQRSSSH